MLDVFFVGEMWVKRWEIISSRKQIFESLIKEP
jgi:hypothetical protein